MWFFEQLCSAWQDFNWLKGSRGLSAAAELLVQTAVRNSWIRHCRCPCRQYQKLRPQLHSGMIHCGRLCTAANSAAVAASDRRHGTAWRRRRATPPQPRDGASLREQINKGLEWRAHESTTHRLPRSPWQHVYLTRARTHARTHTDQWSGALLSVSDNDHALTWLIGAKERPVTRTAACSTVRIPTPATTYWTKLGVH